MPPPLLFDLGQVDLDQRCLSRQQIYETLPHRHEFMLLDGAVLLDVAGGRMVSFCDIREDAWWVRGHVPGRPLLPGIVMLEMAGHTCALLSMAMTGTDAFIGFGGVDDCRFRETVVPPARMYVLCSIKEQRSRRIRCDTQGVVNGRLVFHAVITGLIV